MAYNVRIDEAHRFSPGHGNPISYDRLPLSIQNLCGSSGANTVFYEIHIEYESFKPEVDFSRWDPVRMKETYSLYQQNNIAKSSSSTNATKSRSKSTSNEGGLVTDVLVSTITRSPGSVEGEESRVMNKKSLLPEKRRPLTRKQKTLNHKKKRKDILSNTIHMIRSKYSYSLESGITVIDKKSYCLLSNQPYNGSYYVLLMTHPLNGKKSNTNISYSTDPIHEIFLHNNLLANDRGTSVAAPFWGADAILGPFCSLGKTVSCSKELVDNTRGITSKRNKTIELHETNNVNLYLSRVHDIVPYKEFIRDVTPPNYIKAYRDLFM